MGGAGAEARGRLSPHITLTSSRVCGIDAYGVRGFGSAMPENLFSGAAFALHAILAGCCLQSFDLFFYMSVIFL